MEERLYCIKDRKLFLLERDGSGAGKLRELPDGILRGAVRRTADAAKRREWKVSGEGAKFTNTYEAGADAESRVAAIRASVYGIGAYEDALYYSETIDGVSGIYRKNDPDDTVERIAASGNDCVYGAFDIRGCRMAVDTSFAGETHIGLCVLPSFTVYPATEGHTVDRDPAWSEHDPDVVVFSSAGLPELTADDPGQPQNPANGGFVTPNDVLNMMQASADLAARQRLLGPAAVCSVNTATGAFETLLENDAYNYLKPRVTADGSLLCIRRPYETQPAGEEPKPLGCLADLFLLPVRLIRALFGFLSFFSIKYSGKPLSGNTSGGAKAKQKDEGQIFIDGNLIHAEKELRANAADENPGYMPKSSVLLRRTPDGKEEILCRGVLAYTFDPEGRIVYSNGKYILRLENDGTTTRLAAADGVTALKYMAV